MIFERFLSVSYFKHEVDVSQASCPVTKFRESSRETSDIGI